MNRNASIETGRTIQIPLRLLAADFVAVGAAGDVPDPGVTPLPPLPADQGTMVLVTTRLAFAPNLTKTIIMDDPYITLE